MTRKTWALLGALLTLSVLAGGGGTTGALADAPVAQAWWWAPNDSALPATPPAVPVVTVPLTPPDVPPDGLYVATNATGMEAMSALLYVIPEGAKANTLTLDVTGTTAGEPVVQLCPTQSAWAQVQGGAWGSRPQYVCTADSPKGTLSPDGLTMTWPLGALGANQAIDVALVPLVPEGVAAPTRITFSKPSPQSLTVTPAPSDEPFSMGPTEVAEPSTSFDSIDVVAASGSSLAGDYSSFSGPAVQQSVPVAGAAPRTNFVNPTPGNGLAAHAAVPQSAARDLMQTVGMFGLIVLAAVYARFSGQPAREPRSLVHFSKHGDGPDGGAAA